MTMCSGFIRNSLKVIDGSGRRNQILAGAGFAVTFWADHAAKEVRIVDISKLPRV